MESIDSKFDNIFDQFNVFNDNNGLQSDINDNLEEKTSEKDGLRSGDIIRDDENSTNKKFKQIIANKGGTIRDLFTFEDIMEREDESSYSHSIHLREYENERIQQF